jgi:MFS family permease
MFKNRWWALTASFLGMIFGPGPVLVFALAVFLRPVTQDLGIDRSLISSASLVATTIGLVGGPSVGWLIDRFGARRVMIPGILLFAGGIACDSLLTSTPLMIYGLFCIANIFSAAASPIAFSIVIARWFDEMRGFALGIALAGIGIGTAVVPQYTAYFIAHDGWRFAYIALAAAIVVTAWLPVVLFIHEPPEFQRKTAQQRPPTENQPGMTARAAFRHWHFWALTVAFFLGGVAINGTLAHVVALLLDRGMPLPAAAGSLGAAGIALIFGRLAAGWCLDRFNGPVIAAVCFAIPIAGILMLAGAVGDPKVGTALCGFGIGAEVDLMGFFLSRYCGIKAFGRIYGVCFAFFTLGNALGALAGGLSFDYLHSYTPAFVGFSAALLLACVLFLTLGAYPYPARRHGTPPTGAPEEIAA